MYIITYACNPSGTGMENLNKYTYSYGLSIIFVPTASYSISYNIIF